tara:strand:- start:194 stop:490 length:297 start_codon:yes stop_codon:yes gene_type:complete
MEIINYIVSLVLIGIAFLLKFKPNLIAGYNSLSQEKIEKFPINKLVLGFCFTAFIKPVVAYNIRFGEYYTTADWSFLFTVTLGIVITLLAVHKKFNQE